MGSSVASRPPDGRALEFLASVGPALALDPETVQQLDANEVAQHYDELLARAAALAIQTTEKPPELELNVLVLKTLRHGRNLNRVLQARYEEIGKGAVQTVLENSIQWVNTYLDSLLPEADNEMDIGLLPDESPDDAADADDDADTESLADKDGPSDDELAELEAKTQEAERDSRPIQSAEFQTDFIRRYGAIVGKFPRLTAEQEVALGKRIEAGVYATHLKNTAKNLKPERRAELALIAKDGKKAFDTFLESNLRLAWHFAKRRTGYGVELEDLIQECNLGLIRAIRGWDYTRGYKFSSYASWWIQEYRDRAIATQGRTVRLPINVVDTLQRTKRRQEEFFQEHQRPPTDAELAERVGISPEKLQYLSQKSQPLLSLNEALDTEDDSLFDPSIKDTLPPETSISSLSGPAFRKLMERLPEDDGFFLTLAYGLDRNPQLNLPAIGKLVNISNYRLRHRIERGLSMLRHPSFNAIDLFGIETEKTGRAWQQAALCREVGPELFFSNASKSFAEGKKVCQLCPVRRICLRTSLSSSSMLQGLWGGKTKVDRDALRRRQAASRKESAAKGTTS